MSRRHRLRGVNGPEDNRVPPYAVRDSWSRSKQLVARAPQLSRLWAVTQLASCLGLLGLTLEALGCDAHSGRRTLGLLRAHRVRL